MAHPFTGGSIDQYIAAHEGGGSRTRAIDLSGGIKVEPVPGLPGAVLVTVPGSKPTLFGASDFLTATQQGSGPAFSGTQAGLQLQAELNRQTQAENNAAALERQGLIERAAGERQKAADAAAKIRQLIGTVGSGVQAQLTEAGAFRRGLLGEAGAGARSELEQATQRRGQSIQAVLDTGRNLTDLTSRPSDFVRLAANAQGIQPVGQTPTDTLLGQQRQFFQNQLGAANAAPRSFADLFGEAREGVGGFGTAPSFADLFRQARSRIGGFQFGGRPQEEPGVIQMERGRDGSFERAAIVGENQRPELVFGATEVIPNLSVSELRLLREGGVGGAQFGVDLEEGEPNVFDFPVLRPDAGRQPLFTGGLTRIGAGGVGATTRAPALNPLDFSFSRFANLAPFEQQLAFGRFGETIVDPETDRIQRAGIDPETAFELIRRSSLFGSAPARSRFG